MMGGEKLKERKMCDGVGGRKRESDGLRRKVRGSDRHAGKKEMSGRREKELESERRREEAKVRGMGQLHLQVSCRSPLITPIAETR